MTPFGVIGPHCNYWMSYYFLIFIFHGNISKLIRCTLSGFDNQTLLANASGADHWRKDHHITYTWLHILDYMSSISMSTWEETVLAPVLIQIDRAIPRSVVSKILITENPKIVFTYRSCYTKVSFLKNIHNRKSKAKPKVCCVHQCHVDIFC